jgi:Flp pilus assembly pilin Flp
LRAAARKTGKQGQLPCRKEEVVEMLQSLVVRAGLTFRAAGKGEEGQAMVEYALIIFLVSIVSIAVLTTLGGTVSSVFNEIVQDI